MCQVPGTVLVSTCAVLVLSIKMILTTSLKRWIILFVMCSSMTPAAAGADGQSLREQYESLPPKGKFATGAVVGFVGAKVVVGSAVKAAKVAGAAFLA